MHNLCVPSQTQKHDPMPCADVNLDRGVADGFAVLKDIRGATQYLLIPTTPISGIESPALLDPATPNYFADAWAARRFVNESAHQVLPREDISLAVNSLASRSQDQLHIHIDCVRVDVRAAIRLHNAEIGEHWAVMTTPLARTSVPGDVGRRGENLSAKQNPFRLLGENVAGAKLNMGERTLAVIGARRADGAPGFVLLEDQVRGSAEQAHSEDVEDHACRVAQLPVPASAALGSN